jgi:hypothetical protein
MFDEISACMNSICIYEVADPDRKFSGGNSDEWGQFSYKLGFLKKYFA